MKEYHNPFKEKSCTKQENNSEKEPLMEAAPKGSNERSQNMIPDSTSMYTTDDIFLKMEEINRNLVVFGNNSNLSSLLLVSLLCILVGAIIIWFFIGRIR